MLRFRLWNAAMLAWVFVLCGWERLYQGPPISPFVYPLCGAVAIVIVALPRGLHAPRLVFAGVAITAYVALGLSLGYRINAERLPLVVTELGMLGVTLLLSRRIAWNVLRFEEAAVEVITADLTNRAMPFEQGQEEMYREIRRARQFERPLTLVSLRPTHASKVASVHRFLQQAQRESIERYIHARMADLLARETGDCDVVTYGDGKFVLLLAETGRERAEEVVRSLEQRAQAELGLSLQSGIASFPDEEVTFSGLLSRAGAELRAEAAATAAAANGHGSLLKSIQA